MALHKHATVDGYLKKKDLQELAQPYADVSFCQTDVVNAQYYSAWSSMTTLINKELVDKKGNPAKYQLTESGKSLASRLDQAEADLFCSSASTAFHLECGEKFPAKPVTPVKATSKGDVKAPRVRKAIAQTARPTTLRGIDTPSTSNGILQPDDLIVIDDDEFDRYAQQRLFSNSNKRDVAANPVKPAIQEEEIVVEEQPVPYTHIHDKVTLKAGEYDIVLCVDIAEVSGYGSGNVSVRNDTKVINMIFAAEVQVLERTKKKQHQNLFKTVGCPMTYASCPSAITCGFVSLKQVQVSAVIRNWHFRMSLNESEWTMSYRVLKMVDLKNKK